MRNMQVAESVNHQDTDLKVECAIRSHQCITCNVQTVQSIKHQNKSCMAMRWFAMEFNWRACKRNGEHDDSLCKPSQLHGIEMETMEFKWRAWD